MATLSGPRPSVHSHQSIRFDSRNIRRADHPFALGIIEPEADAFCESCDSFHEPLAHEFEAITLDVQPVDIIHATDPDCPCWSDDAHVRAGTFCPECVERKRRELAEVIEVVRPVRKGPSLEDQAFEMGRSAALGSGRAVEAPGTLSPSERDAFLAGYQEGCEEYHRVETAAIDESRLQAEVEETMCVAAD